MFENEEFTIDISNTHVFLKAQISVWIDVNAQLKCLHVIIMWQNHITQFIYSLIGSMLGYLSNTLSRLI